MSIKNWKKYLFLYIYQLIYTLLNKFSNLKRVLDFTKIYHLKIYVLHIYNSIIKNYEAKKEFEEVINYLSELFDELFSKKA